MRGLRAKGGIVVDDELNASALKLTGGWPARGRIRPPPSAIRPAARRDAPRFKSAEQAQRKIPK